MSVQLEAQVSSVKPAGQVARDSAYLYALSPDAQRAIVLDNKSHFRFLRLDGLDQPILGSMEVAERFAEKRGYLPAKAFSYNETPLSSVYRSPEEILRVMSIMHTTRLKVSL
jgi:hypothetical protein